MSDKHAHIHSQTNPTKGMTIYVYVPGWIDVYKNL